MRPGDFPTDTIFTSFNCGPSTEYRFTTSADATVTARNADRCALTEAGIASIASTVVEISDELFISEEQLQRELEVAWSASVEDRVEPLAAAELWRETIIGHRGGRPEGRAVNSCAEGAKVGLIERIEHVDLETQPGSLMDGEFAMQRQIELPQGKPANRVAAKVAGNRLSPHERRRAEGAFGVGGGRHNAAGRGCRRSRNWSRVQLNTARAPLSSVLRLAV